MDRFVSLATLGGFARWIFQFSDVDNAIELECSFELMYFLNFIHLRIRRHKTITVSSVLYPFLSEFLSQRGKSIFTTSLPQGKIPSSLGVNK